MNKILILSIIGIFILISTIFTFSSINQSIIVKNTIDDKVSDDDHDGIINVIDAFDKNPAEWDDFDFDGVGANEDEDDDNDGILDFDDSSPSPISSQLTMTYLDLIEDCELVEPGLLHQLCYRDFFTSLIKTESIPDILDLAFFYAKLGVIDDCHFTIHRIGQSSFDKNSSLRENLEKGKDTCRDGFYHGILTAYFDNLKNEGKDISKWYGTSCDEFVDTSKFQPCVHGIGHGLVFYYDNDIESSIDACRELQSNQYDWCMDGLFMQYTDNKLTKSTSFEETITEICTEIELTNSEKQKCNSLMGRTLGFLTNHDFDKSHEFCKQLDSNYIHSCTMGALWEIIESEFVRDYGSPNLDENTTHGQAMITIGDLDSNGVGDVAIGMSNILTGGDLREGAGRIVFMNSNGTIQSVVKISDWEKMLPREILEMLINVPSVNFTSFSPEQVP